MPDFHVTVVCGKCGTRQPVVLGSAGVCQCGAPYDTARLPAATVDASHKRAAGYQSRRKMFIVQMLLVMLSLLIISRSAPGPVTIAAGSASWYWFGWRGWQKLREADHETTQHRL